MARTRRWTGPVADLARQLLAIAAVPAVIGLAMLLEPGPIPGEKRTPSLAHDGGDHARTCTACRWRLREEAAEKAARAVAALDNASDEQVEHALDRDQAPATAARPLVMPDRNRVDVERIEDCSSL